MDHTLGGDWILGFDIGGTKTAAVAGTVDGEIVDRVVFPSAPGRGFEPMWGDLVAAGRELVARHGKPSGVGASIGGPLDSTRGIIYSPPNLPGWDEIPLKDLLAQAFGIPAEIEHDAKACALAEWLFGAARGKRTIVFLTFGTGLGAGLILDGRLHRGATETAGEVGHWRIAGDGPLVYGKRGSWEGYSSGAGIAGLTAFLFPGCFGDAEEAAVVIDRARQGDQSALHVVETSARALGHGIALLVDLLNPQMVVLGSLGVRAGDLFLPMARTVLDAEALPRSAAACEIVPAALGEQIGDVAALCPVIYRRGQSPAGVHGRRV